MARPGDTLVLILLIGVIFFFLLRNWISFSFITDWINDQSQQDEPKEIKGEIPDLLRRNGYTVVKSKDKTELDIEVDDECYQSRLYVDYIVHKEEEKFIVMVARDRKPLRMSGPGLRDFFLTYYLIYQPDGILYVNREKGSIKVIRFEYPNKSLQPKLGFNWFYIVAALIGMILAMLTFK